MLRLRLVILVATLAGLAVLPTTVSAQPCATTRCVSVPEPATITLLASGASAAGVAALWRAWTKNKKK